VRDQPEIVLTRHFFASLFTFGFLTDEGAESLKRALLGSLAVALAIGLLLTRMFMKKYGMLSAGPIDAYVHELMADHAFLVAVPMWFVGAAVALCGHSLFPDRTDFRVLMAEPLSRLTIFTAKLASLLLFVGLFVAGTHLALLPLTAFTMIGAMKTGSLVTTALAFGVSSLSASLFAALAVVAVHGLLVTFALNARVLAFSGAVRSVLVGVLVLCVPLLARLPGTAIAFASDAWWLSWAPPAWFVGLERWLLGDGRHAALAARAAIATVLVLVVSVASYVRLYRRFDRVMLEPASAQSGRGWSRSLAKWVGRAPVRNAIRRFVSITVRRSVLHQGLMVGLLAAAGGFVLNALLNATGWNQPLDLRLRSPFLLTILWAPTTMMLLAIPAVRLALSVPLDLRSNWIFRMTEDAAGRAEVAAASVRSVLALGVAVPIALLAPVQWWVLGRAAAPIIALEALIGWLVVEWVMADWRRIPFTCSYIPGKGFVPHMFVKAFATYVFFTTATTVFLRVALAHPRVGLVVALMVAAAAVALCRHRTRHAPLTPLMFDDELPTDVNPLRLNAD
jgi:RNase P protein component